MKLTIVGIMVAIVFAGFCFMTPPAKRTFHVYVMDNGIQGYHGDDGAWYWYASTGDTGWARTTITPSQLMAKTGCKISEEEEETPELLAEQTQPLDEFENDVSEPSESSPSSEPSTSDDSSSDSGGDGGSD